LGNGALLLHRFNAISTLPWSVAMDTSHLRLVDVIDTLDRPEEYLRGILQNMMLCKRRHGSANVLIGTTGRGIAPHYRIEPDQPDLDIWLDSKTDLSPFFIAYHGRSHKRLDWGLSELQHASWSMEASSLEDVQLLLGKLRGYTKSKRGMQTPR
jgi:hypothetical protein